MLDDSSLELRYEAIVRRLSEIGEREQQSAAKEAVAKEYRELLTHARDLEQIKEITEKLKSFGISIDLEAHYGFVMDWRLIGPFDNSDKRGLGQDYPPEQQVNFAAKHDGKLGSMTWIETTTDDPTGAVDLNKALGKNMGAVAYAAAVFESDQERPVDLRLSTPNANKLWLNGKLLLEARGVPHGFSD